MRMTNTPTAGAPGHFNFAWNSQPAKVYDLLSSTDLSTASAGWEFYDPDGPGGSDPYSDIPSAGASTMVTGVSALGPRRFFVVRETGAAPE